MVRPKSPFRQALVRRDVRRFLRRMCGLHFKPSWINYMQLFFSFFFLLHSWSQQWDELFFFFFFFYSTHPSLLSQHAVLAEPPRRVAFRGRKRNEVKLTKQGEEKKNTALTKKEIKKDRKTSVLTCYNVWGERRVLTSAKTPDGISREKQKLRLDDFLTNLNLQLLVWRWRRSSICRAMSSVSKVHPREWLIDTVSAVRETKSKVYRSIKVHYVGISQRKKWHPCLIVEKVTHEQVLNDSLQGTATLMALSTLHFNQTPSSPLKAWYWELFRLLQHSAAASITDVAENVAADSCEDQTCDLSVACIQPPEWSGSLQSTGLITSHISHWNDQLGVTSSSCVCCQATLRFLRFWQVAIYSLQTETLWAGSDNDDSKSSLFKHTTHQTGSVWSSWLGLFSKILQI